MLVDPDRRRRHAHGGERLAEDEQPVGLDRDRPGCLGIPAERPGRGSRRRAGCPRRSRLTPGRSARRGPAPRYSASASRSSTRPRGSPIRRASWVRRTAPCGSPPATASRGKAATSGEPGIRLCVGTPGVRARLGGQRVGRRVDHPGACALPGCQPALGDQFGVGVGDGVAGQSEVGGERSRRRQQRARREPAGADGVAQGAVISSSRASRAPGVMASRRSRCRSRELAHEVTLELNHAGGTLGASVEGMTRLEMHQVSPELYDAMMTLSTAAAKDVDPTIGELIKIRASQINHCAFCLDMHTTDARKHGETEQRLALRRRVGRGGCALHRSRAGGARADRGDHRARQGSRPRRGLRQGRRGLHREGARPGDRHGRDHQRVEPDQRRDPGAGPAPLTRVPPPTRRRRRRLAPRTARCGSPGRPAACSRRRPPSRPRTGRAGRPSPGTRRRRRGRRTPPAPARCCGWSGRFFVLSSGGSCESSKYPATPAYGPCFAITVRGSKTSHAAASPP